MTPEDKEVITLAINSAILEAFDTYAERLDKKIRNIVDDKVLVHQLACPLGNELKTTKMKMIALVAVVAMIGGITPELVGKLIALLVGGTG